MMSRSKVLSLFFFFILLLTACGSQKKVVVAAPKALPSWYTSVAPTSSTELYGIGEGRDREEAIAQALNAMVSSLSVSLSSDYRAKTVVTEGRSSSVDARYESDIQSSVKEIRISNYTVVDAISLGFKRYAVLIKSNKKQLFETLQEETKQELTLLENREKNLAGVNALKKIAFYQEAHKSLENLPNRVLVMSVLSSGFDGSRYLAQMQEYETKHERLLERLRFVVKSSQNAQNLTPVIEKWLSKERFKVAKLQREDDLRVELKATIQKANAYGFTLARSEIAFVTKDSRGNVVATNRINLTGQSSQGYEVAKQNLAFALDTLIEKEGISTVLGLGI